MIIRQEIKDNLMEILMEIVIMGQDRAVVQEVVTA